MVSHHINKCGVDILHQIELLTIWENITVYKFYVMQLIFVVLNQYLLSPEKSQQIF